MHPQHLFWQSEYFKEKFFEILGLSISTALHAYSFSIWCTMLAINRRSEEDKAFSSLSVHTLLSRDILLSFPTVGTILRVSLSSHLFHRVKPGDWVELYQLLFEVDKGSWVIKVTNSTKVRHLTQDDCLVEKIMRLVLLEVSFANYFRFCLPRESLTFLFSFLSYVPKTRLYNKRISSKLGHIPFWCFPSPPGLTGCNTLITLLKENFSLRSRI